MKNAVSVLNITKKFQKFTALNNISFQVDRGKFVALLGANGAGKTTAMAVILGLLKPDRGEVKIFGCDINRQRYGILNRINFSSPYIDLPKRLTVEENLKVYAKLYGVSDFGSALAKLAAELDFGELMQKTYGSLSAGQRTRVLLAKALLNRPELLLLDEPTASLDPDIANRLRENLRRYAEENKATVLLASHNMREVELLCSEIILLDKGRIVSQSSPAALFARFGKKNMEEVFLHLAGTGTEGL